MSVERPETCGAVREELTRLTCGDVAEPSPVLQIHLADCPACREELEASKELVGALRTALEPEPLPERLQAAILARVKAELAATAAVTASRRVASWSLRGACVAAAAAVLAVILIPSGARLPLPEPPAGQAGGIVLNADDSAAIAEAWLLAQGDSLADDLVDSLSDQVEDVSRAVQRDTGARTYLPWSKTDDWDVPASDGKSAAPAQPICAEIGSKAASKDPWRVPLAACLPVPTEHGQTSRPWHPTLIETALAARFCDA